LQFALLSNFADDVCPCRSELARRAVLPSGAGRAGARGTPTGSMSGRLQGVMRVTKPSGEEDALSDTRCETMLAMNGHAEDRAIRRNHPMSVKATMPTSPSPPRDGQRAHPPAVFVATDGSIVPDGAGLVRPWR
jgi:hypothetical protein